MTFDEWNAEPYSRTFEDAWKAGAASRDAVVESLRQQLEQAYADIAGLHDQLEEPQIAQDDYRLNKLELEQLRQQLAKALAACKTKDERNGT